MMFTGNQFLGVGKKVADIRIAYFLNFLKKYQIWNVAVVII